MKLSDLIQQSRFESPAQEAVLNVLATQSWISGRMTAVFADENITAAQYNVLRILRGHHPEPMSCSQIGDRLLDRTPDVTRLLTRLEKAGYINRARATCDRRAAEISITQAGLDQLATLDEPLRAVNQRITSGLSDAELTTLSDLLERLRADQT